MSAYDLITCNAQEIYETQRLLWKSLRSRRRGDTDVSMETWVNNIQAVWDEVIVDGTVIDLAPTFPKAPPGRYVPTRLEQAPA